MNNKAFVLSITLLLMLSALLVPAAPAEGGTTTSKRPVAELFVYVGCHYCTHAEDAIPKVTATTDALVLEYHLWSADIAGWNTPEGDALAEAYGITGTPAVMVDGAVKLPGADPSGYGSQDRFTESCEDAYISAVNGRPDTTQASLETSLARTNDELSAEAAIGMDALFTDGLKLRFVVYETQATYDGRTYRNVVRAILSPEAITQPGEYSVYRNFSTPSDTQNVDALGIAVLLYSSLTGEVFQSSASLLSSSPPSSDQLDPGAVGEDQQNAIPAPRDERELPLLNITLVMAAVGLAVVVALRWRKV
ncbi:MAG: hypothetical protein KAT70_08500 [Thermoplasmata archaeon]|nr:hypothetical protein [Thermoplasmata archaeon]